MPLRGLLAAPPCTHTLTHSSLSLLPAGECLLEESDSPDVMADKCLTNVRKAGTELVAAGYCMYR